VRRRRVGGQRGLGPPPPQGGVEFFSFTPSFVKTSSNFPFHTGLPTFSCEASSLETRLCASKSLFQMAQVLCPLSLTNTTPPTIAPKAPRFPLHPPTNTCGTTNHHIPLIGGSLFSSLSGPGEACSFSKLLSSTTRPREREEGQ